MAHTAFLIPHPHNIQTAPLEIAATLAWGADGALRCNYLLRGDLSAYSIPLHTTHQRGEALWQHTCLECFISGEEGSAYREFNFSPSGAWQIYHFEQYRKGEALALESASAVYALSIRQSPRQISLDCSIPSHIIPPGQHLRFGLAAVMEDNMQRLSYWALCHGAGKPDFHARDTFSLSLPRP